MVVLNLGESLPSDNYTFTVVGTTSITDYAGRSLDGNGNGTGGDNFSVSFTVDAPAVGTSTASASLPDTGFTPGVMTVLPPQLEEDTYANLGDLWLEIPRLGLQMPIVGVPAVESEWDVTWLGENAGWVDRHCLPNPERQHGHYRACLGCIRQPGLVCQPENAQVWRPIPNPY